MQTVADRFFEAFDALLAMGETKIQTFCREGGIDKRNFYKKRDNTDSRREIPTAWLTFRFCEIVNKAKAMKREFLQVFPKGLSTHNRACVAPPARIWPAFR